MVVTVMVGVVALVVVAVVVVLDVLDLVTSWLTLRQTALAEQGQLIPVYWTQLRKLNTCVLDDQPSSC